MLKSSYLRNKKRLEKIETQVSLMKGDAIKYVYEVLERIEKEEKDKDNICPTL